MFPWPYVKEFNKKKRKEKNEGTLLTIIFLLVEYITKSCILI
jgi:hypothetical protein